MKKYLIIILCLLYAHANVSGLNFSDEERERIDINIDTSKESIKEHRSILISAYILKDSQTVDVYINSLSQMTVYIIDSNNVLIDHKRISPDNNSIINLSTNGPGDYLLIIESDDFYAEGMFTI